MKSEISLVATEEPLVVIQAREDEARVTGQAYTERPYWYRNEVTGQLYYDVYGCLGWPSEVSDKGDGLPGYVAVVGAVKKKDSTGPVKDAAFQLLAEYEHKDVPTLLEAALEMRSRFGYGLRPDLLRTFYGDPDRFISITALLNERLTVGNPNRAFLLTPPLDFYETNFFDICVRSFRSVIMPDKVRFYFGKMDILKGRLKEFHNGDPAVLAVGGLIHALLSGTMWMDTVREHMFVVEEGI